MKIMLPTFIFILNGVLLFSQTTAFQKSFGGPTAFEYGYAMQLANDGGMVTAGCTFSYGGSGCHRYVVKLDASGNEVWAKAYASNQTEVINDMANTSDGGFLFCGYSYTGTNDTNRACIVRTNSAGDTLWSAFWPVADAYAITQASDGNVLVAGLTASTWPAPSDAFLLKLNGNTGDTLWTRVFGGTQQDWFYGIEETSDGGIILAGYTASFGAGQNDILLVKTDGNGNPLWEKTYGTTGQEEAYGHCVQQTSDHGFIVSGYSTTDSAVCLVKTDPTGNILWQKKYRCANSFYIGSHAVEQTGDKGYIVAGWRVRYPQGNNEPLLFKTDSLGNITWATFYGGNGDDLFYDVKQTADGGYAACGRDYSFESNGDVYFVKTDPNGNSGCYQSDTVLNVFATTYSATNITMPLSHRSQTFHMPTTVTNGYSEIPLCLTTGNEEKTSSEKLITVFPNPFSSSTTFRTTSAFRNATLTLYNSCGQEVRTVRNISGNTFTLQRGNLPGGVYFLQLVQDDKIADTEKIIITGN